MSISFQFNFVGKLLGPRGNSLKKLQDDTMTKMAVLGRGSMRNKQHVNIFSKPYSELKKNIYNKYLKHTHKKQIFMKRNSLSNNANC